MEPLVHITVRSLLSAHGCSTRPWAIAPPNLCACDFVRRHDYDVVGSGTVYRALKQQRRPEMFDEAERRVVSVDMAALSCPLCIMLLDVAWETRLPFDDIDWARKERVRVRFLKQFTIDESVLA